VAPKAEGGQKITYCSGFDDRVEMHQFSPNS
jgi:hypothetical protein